jgi:molybdenum cofactor guanylyltransferase
MIPLPCVILAGGKSSRMGSDKALLPFGGFATLTQYQIHRLSPFFQSLHVSTKNKEKFDFQASFIEDISTYKESSPLVALLSILEKFETPVCVLSVDTPFVDAEVFETLFSHLDGTHDAIIASSPTCSHQLCAIYAPTLKSKITERLGRNEHKIRTLLAEVKTKYIDFTSDTPFLNLNLPEEYTKAKELI